jgi:hypothetical protein
MPPSVKKNAACACVCTRENGNACACTEDLSKHTRKILAKCLNAALQFMETHSGFLDLVHPRSESACECEEDKDYCSKVLHLKGLTLLRDIHHRKSYQDVDIDHNSHFVTMVRVKLVMNFFRQIDTLLEDFYRDLPESHYEPVHDEDGTCESAHDPSHLVGEMRELYTEDKYAIYMIGLAAATVTRSHCPENKDIHHFMGGLTQHVGITEIWSDLIGGV